MRKPSNNELPLKFQGVYQNTNEVQERKRKKKPTLINSPNSLCLASSSSIEFLDGVAVDLQKTTKESSGLLKGN